MIANNQLESSEYLAADGTKAKCYEILCKAYCAIMIFLQTVEKKNKQSKIGIKTITMSVRMTMKITAIALGVTQAVI